MGFIDAIRSEIDRAVTRLACSLVRRGLVGTASSSSYFLQVAGDDESGTETFEAAESWQHFGFTSRPPAGGEVALICPGGEGAGGIVVAEQDRAHRPSLAAESDVCLYGKKGTGQPTVLLEASGKVTITGGGATPGIVVLAADGSITVTPGTGKTVAIGGTTDYQILGTTFVAAFAAMAAATDPATTMALVNAILVVLKATTLSTKAKVG